ncbi:MAG TPA: hypothetical protein DCE14_05555 [Kosmotogaceae bacterium]|nr:MAG: Phosphate uptake regulator, PhoU [Thermotogales bacterium 46_20]HAA85801.1 hypothetical protein [Kosmotogaceae bacterium]
MVSEVGFRLVEETRQEALKMARLVQSIFHKTASSLLDRNIHSAREAISLASSVRHLENAINRRATASLGVLRLKGQNLRFFSAAMSITRLLRLISEKSVELSERSLVFARRPPFGFHENLRYALGTVDIMLREAVENLIAPSIADAERVCRKDLELDEKLEMTEREIIEAMSRTSALIEKGITLIAVFRDLRSIALLCGDLMELSMFIHTGSDYHCLGPDGESSSTQKH